MKLTVVLEFDSTEAGAAEIGARLLRALPPENPLPRVAKEVTMTDVQEPQPSEEPEQPSEAPEEPSTTTTDPTPPGAEQPVEEQQSGE